jgi:hypothetical protein
MRRDVLGELAYVIMEAEKPHDRLPDCSSWDAGCGVQFKPEVPEQGKVTV